MVQDIVAEVRIKDTHTSTPVRVYDIESTLYMYTVVDFNFSHDITCTCTMVVTFLPIRLLH